MKATDFLYCHLFSILHVAALHKFSPFQPSQNMWKGKQIASVVASYSIKTVLQMARYGDDR